MEGKCAKNIDPVDILCGQKCLLTGKKSQITKQWFCSHSHNGDSLRKKCVILRDVFAAQIYYTLAYLSDMMVCRMLIRGIVLVLLIFVFMSKQVSHVSHTCKIISKKMRGVYRVESISSITCSLQWEVQFVIGQFDSCHQLILVNLAEVRDDGLTVREQNKRNRELLVGGGWVWRCENFFNERQQGQALL